MRSATVCGLVATVVAVVLLRRRTSGAAPIIAVLRSVPRLPPLDQSQQWTTADSTAVRSGTPRRFSAAAAGRLGLPLHWDVPHLVSTGGAAPLAAFEQRASEFVLARGHEAEYERSRGVAHVNVTLERFWAAAAADAPGSSLLYHTGPLAAWPAALGG